MVQVSLHKSNISESEEAIVIMLYKSLRSEIEGLQCDHCSLPSEVVLHVDKTKMYAISTAIIACCSSFEDKINDRLNAPAEI